MPVPRIANAIVTDRLSRSFGPIRAVDGLSLTVPAGSVFGFLGPNGAGKTTTIHLLLGLIAPDGGTVSVMGHDPVTEGDRVRMLTGALLEHPGLYERLSAEENLDFFGRLCRMHAPERRDRVREVLTRFGLWERRGDRIATWSRGMKQKLAVARALLHRPPLVFLDEPTAGLDPGAAASIRDDLDALSEREGVTVFLTTHNLDEAEKLCDTVAVISRGGIIASGTPKDLRSRGGTPRAVIEGRGFTEGALASLRAIGGVVAIEHRNGTLVIDHTPGMSLAPLVRLLVESGAAIEEVRRDAPSLEDTFLALLGES